MSGPFTIQIDLPGGFEGAGATLALGGELKSSLCLIRDGRAQLTEAIGDLEQEDIYRHFIRQVESQFEGILPVRLVIDRHPDYLSSQWGEKLARQHGIELTAIQHHHAHIAAVMADNARPIDTKPVLGFALDGLGFGDDGTIWGGEILLADYHGFQRLACFQPVAMLGGAAAIHEPWRNTMAHLMPLWHQVSDQFIDVDIVQFLQGKPVSVLKNMIESGLNSPPASSCGRLFDAVAAALGVYRERVEFEAQAAINLEQLATSCFEDVSQPYAMQLDEGDCLILNWQPMWLEILSDLQNGVEAAHIASRFHHTLIHALTLVATQLRGQHGFDRIALSGGVFQNRLLSNWLPKALAAQGFEVLQHKQVPAHDGGLSLGQAVVASVQAHKKSPQL
ncbi:carbamoyltransferase HypF [Mariprofundus sp. KV]|uniref:carbamoyltransferase HypF n=1 Tax=Mariprofundus sp. KV TaxID=2608715 RepID=UPI0015A0531E|nr:carbamoyltransferase HypF [Mariprofundus sp. KV]NWF36192.1 carbamoyltransferase HypF [Mariprofundus sp. KV]